jgi:predicted component of type VI protein secretion system
MIDICESIKREYDNKNQFIKDFLKLCREIKKEEEDRFSKRKRKITVNAKISDQNTTEEWKFIIYIENERIFTEATVSLNGKTTQYPKTEWGDSYRRWDSELLEFLRREVCKI